MGTSQLDERATLEAAEFDAVEGEGRLLASLGRTAYAVAAIVLLIVVWWALSLRLRPWVPSPMSSYEAGISAVTSVEFYSDLVLTLRRILVSFVVAGLAGSILGVIVGLSRRAEAFAVPVLAVALAIPDPVYIIFAILLLGSGEVASLTALTIAVAPFVTNIVRSNVEGRDQRLDNMATVYRIPRMRALRHILLPQLVPAFLSAGRTAFALSWKIVVVVEALSRPDGVGAAIYQSFRLLRMREMVALAILFTVLMEVIERLALGTLQRRVSGWRRVAPS